MTEAEADSLHAEFAKLGVVVERNVKAEAVFRRMKDEPKPWRPAKRGDEPPF